MSHAFPDPVMARRVAALERQVEQLQQQLRRMATSRGVTPLGARLWRATLNEPFGATTAHSAAADLLMIGGTDTGLDVTLFDPLDVFASLIGTEGLYVIEQMDPDGTNYFVPKQCPCP